jgi:hypothetical protein
MRAAAPSLEIHFLNRGAFSRSHPVAPPIRIIGDNDVPTPNRTANAKLSTGEANDTE